MDLATSNNVIVRDNFGRFAAQLEENGLQMMKGIAEEGARLSRSFAPVGHKADRRTKSLQDSIETSYSSTRASWTCTARHALPQETGSRPHDITGNVSFFWEREGRPWSPGTNTIRHPGNPSRPFMRPAYEIVSRDWMIYARKAYGA